MGSGGAWLGRGGGLVRDRSKPAVIGVGADKAMYAFSFGN